MKCLLIIDIQNDFLPGGALAVAGGDEVVPIVNLLMPEYELVIATQDWHPIDHGSFAESYDDVEPFEMGKLGELDQCFWPTHCVQGTEGAEFAPDLNTGGIKMVVRKGQDRGVDSYSGFYDNGGYHSTGLTEILLRRGVTEVHIVGLALDYCVKFTALDAVKDGFKTYLIPEACRAVNVNEGDSLKAIEEMKEAGVRMKEITRPVTTTLYRPTGVNELAKVEASGWKKWPARLPEQPIFYPVTNEQYASEIASRWNTKDKTNGAIGYVTEFEVKTEFLDKYQVECVGASHHTEYWIPAEDVDEMNKNIVGMIRVIEEFR